MATKLAHTTSIRRMASSSAAAKESAAATTADTLHQRQLQLWHQHDLMRLFRGRSVRQCTSAADHGCRVTKVVAPSLFGHVALAEQQQQHLHLHLHRSPQLPSSSSLPAATLAVRPVAIKISSLGRLRQAKVKPWSAEDPVEEARVLLQLQAAISRVPATVATGSAHVIRLLDEFVFDDCHWAVVEWAACGDLFGLVEANGALGEPLARSIVRQILLGLRFMHAVGVAHLDIKGENIFVCSRQGGGDGRVPDDVVVKIGDLGMARVIERDAKGLVQPIRGQVGTTKYQDPLAFDSSAPPFDPLLADAYSVGSLLFLLLTGSHAYERPSVCDARFRTLYAGKSGLECLLCLYGYTVAPPAIDLMSKLLCPPHERLSVSQALEHPWFSTTPPPTPPPVASVPSTLRKCAAVKCEQHIPVTTADGVQGLRERAPDPSGAIVPDIRGDVKSTHHHSLDHHHSAGAWRFTAYSPAPSGHSDDGIDVNVSQPQARADEPRLLSGLGKHRRRESTGAEEATTEADGSEPYPKRLKMSLSPGHAGSPRPSQRSSDGQKDAQATRFSHSFLSQHTKRAW